MNTEKLYSVSQIIDYVIEKYKLPTDGAGNSNKMAYRQQIRRTFQKLELWDKAIIIKNGEKETKYFTEHQRQLLLVEPGFYDYVRAKSDDKELRDGKKYADIQRDIATRREAHIEYLNSLNMDEEEDIPNISDETFRRVKNDMMLKALFELFFTPLDEELLMKDLFQTRFIADELSLEPEDIEAENRLNKPEGYYYNRKKNPFETEEPSSKAAKNK